jgi:threonine aldolase
MSSIVALYQDREPFNAPNFFENLARVARELGVQEADVYGDFGSSPTQSHLRRFEAEVATYLEMGDALFLPSGVMAANIVLSIAKSKAKVDARSFICHYSSHLILHERNAWKELLSLHAIVIPPDEGAEVQQAVSFEAFQQALAFSSEVTPIAAILECPHREMGGKITSIEDIRRISALCRERGIHLHMDGARLWEASVAYGDLPSLCSLFDSVYVSMYKGLGGLTGAMLLGSNSYIEEARPWLRRCGGNLFSLLPYFLSSWQGFQLHKGAFPAHLEQLSKLVREVSAALQQEQEGVSSDESALIRFDPVEPVVPLIHVYLRTSDMALANSALQTVAERTGIACIAKLRAGQFGARQQVFTEFSLGPANMHIPVQTWIRGYVCLQRELRRLQAAARGQKPRHSVQVSEVIAAPVDRVWPLFRAFDGLDRISDGMVHSRLLVDAGEGGNSVGSVRHLVVGAAFVQETLLRLDDSRHVLSYEITEGTLPVSNYIASVRLTTEEDGQGGEQTRCDWCADFTVTALTAAPRAGDSSAAASLVDVPKEHVQATAASISALFVHIISVVRAQVSSAV